jgi:hypothetical protein
LPATLMFDYPTIVAVSIFLEDLLFGNLVAAPDAEPETLDDSTDLDRMFDNIESLSEEEANRLYEQKVREN